MSTKLINLIAKIAPTRVHLVVAAVVNIAALILAFVPLFNLVGYESAAAFGVILGIVATGLTVYAVRSGYIEALLSSTRHRGPAADFGRLTVIHLLLALGPLLILVVNGLRVPNCDWSAGLMLWGLIVVPAILLGQGAGWLAVTLFPERRFAPWFVAFAFPVGDAAAMLYHLATEPPIIGHQWFLGYFGGSIYDEALGVPPSLIAYRILHLLAVIVVVAAVQAAFELYRNRLPIWTMILTIGAMVAFFAGFSQRVEMGISIDREHIVEELGGKAETEHFIIYFPQTKYNLDRLDEIKEDHEFRYDQLRRFFGTDPVAENGEKVTSFIYEDRNSKGRLMGGRNTMVAKLWLHEMHIMWRWSGDHMLTHELAHIFTEPFGSGPLRLSMQRGIGVNMGLVEGVAAAAEWSSQELTPHEASAAMRELDIAPDLRRILGAGGFWTEASGTAYTAMGSFVRYLIDEEGIEAFRQAYGGGDFEGAYGVEVEDLIRRWEEYVDTIELTERQKDVARYRYDRTSIFGRDCARALAETRRLARDAASRGALGDARGHYEVYLEDDADNARALLEYAHVLNQMDLCEEALAVVDDRPHELLRRVEEASFLELKGDILWREGKREEAVTAYAEGLELGVPVDRERSLRSKHILAERGESRGRIYLVEGRSDPMGLFRLMQWRVDSPEDPMAAYFVGRRLWQGRNYEGAIAHLENARGAMGAEVLDGEASLMLGQSYYFEGRFDESEAIWNGLAHSSVTRYREAAREWLARLAWARGNSD